MTDIFLVKRAGRYFSFLKRAGRHQKGAGRRTLQKRPRQNTVHVTATHNNYFPPATSHSYILQLPPITTTISQSYLPRLLPGYVVKLQLLPAAIQHSCYSYLTRLFLTATSWSYLWVLAATPSSYSLQLLPPATSLQLLPPATPSSYFPPATSLQLLPPATPSSYFPPATSSSYSLQLHPTTISQSYLPLLLPGYVVKLQLLPAAIQHSCYSYLIRLFLTATSWSYF